MKIFKILYITCGALFFSAIIYNNLVLHYYSEAWANFKSIGYLVILICMAYIFWGMKKTRSKT